MANVAGAARTLLKTLRRDGIEERGKLRLEDEEAERALEELLKFLSRKVSVYTTNHEIVVRKAPHVL